MAAPILPSGAQTSTGITPSTGTRAGQAPTRATVLIRGRPPSPSLRAPTSSPACKIATPILWSHYRLPAQASATLGAGPQPQQPTRPLSTPSHGTWGGSTVHCVPTCTSTTPEAARSFPVSWTTQPTASTGCPLLPCTLATPSAPCAATWTRCGASNALRLSMPLKPLG